MVDGAFSLEDMHMAKWFTVIWYDKELLAETDNNTVVQKQLFGPFARDVQREEAIASLIEEHEDCLLGVVRFDIEGESVPEIVE
jgi:hypothetical protein